MMVRNVPIFLFSLFVITAEFLPLEYYQEIDICMIVLNLIETISVF